MWCAIETWDKLRHDTNWDIIHIQTWNKLNIQDHVCPQTYKYETSDNFRHQTMSDVKVRHDTSLDMIQCAMWNWDMRHIETWHKLTGNTHSDMTQIETRHIFGRSETMHNFKPLTNSDITHCMTCGFDLTRFQTSHIVWLVIFRLLDLWKSNMSNMDLLVLRGLMIFWASE